jgi:hypothetical protein
MSNLTEHEAYVAMFAFLERRYRLSGSHDLAALLGSMGTLSDGGTADPAAWGDWIEAVEAARAGTVRTDMDLR